MEESGDATGTWCAEGTQQPACVELEFSEGAEKRACIELEFSEGAEKRACVEPDSVLYVEIPVTYAVLGYRLVKGGDWSLTNVNNYGTRSFLRVPVMVQDEDQLCRILTVESNELLVRLKARPNFVVHRGVCDELYDLHGLRLHIPPEEKNDVCCRLWSSVKKVMPKVCDFVRVFGMCCILDV